MARTKANSVRQLTIFPRGGRREGAGRKPKGERALAPHARRPKLTPRDPVFVTTHLLRDLPNLRRARTLAILRDALAAGSDRFGFRLVEYSIQSNRCTSSPRPRTRARSRAGCRDCSCASPRR
jgi:hypothetical protein